MTDQQIKSGKLFSLDEINYKKLFFVVLVFSFCNLFIFGQSASVYNANRQTALRCLQLARDSLSKGYWTGSYEQAALGLSYDDSIADLWYVQALSQKARNKSASEVLGLVTESLKRPLWLEYNKNAARILYADLLCDTCQWEFALQILSENPIIITADAEYIKAKSNYRIQSELSRKNARTIISEAINMFPTDSRFPELFFQFEQFTDFETDTEALLIRDRLLSLLYLWEHDSVNIELLASLYSNDQDKKRLLQAYSATNNSSQLFAFEAMKVGLLSQKDAFDMFMSFAQDGLNADLAGNFIQQITDENVLNTAGMFFENYSNTLDFDINGDGITDLTCLYLQGRPYKITYDKNQDGIDDLTVDCDFGSPYAVYVGETNQLFTYEKYPNVSTVSEYLPENKQINNNRPVFSLTPGKLDFSPVNLIQFEPFNILIDSRFPVPLVQEPVTVDGDLLQENIESDISEVNIDEFVQPTELSQDGSMAENQQATLEMIENIPEGQISIVGQDESVTDVFTSRTGNTIFFIPQIDDNLIKPSLSTLAADSVSISISTDERHSGKILFLMQNGKIRSAVYTSNNTPYAQTVFEEGLPVFRNVDYQGDGVFSVTEIYEESDDFSADSNPMKILYGNLPAETFLPMATISLKRVVVDTNNDSMPDFIETYTATGKSVSWDNEGDGLAEIVYTKEGSVEKASFIHPQTKEWVSVLSKEGIPFELDSRNEVKSITKDENYDIFWIGTIPENFYVEKLMKIVTSDMKNGLALITEIEDFTFVLIKIDSKFFGEIMDD